MTGTQFNTNDDVSYDSLRQKTKLISSGTYLDKSSKPIGQNIQVISPLGNYISNKIYSVNSSGVVVPSTLTEGVEQSQKPTQSGSMVPTAGIRYYAFFQLPTTEQFYLITAIGSYCSSSNSNFVTGVDVIEAIPPALASTPLVALCPEQAVPSSVLPEKKTTVVSSKLIPKGALIGVWIHFSVTGTLSMHTTNQSYGDSKTTAYTANPKFSNNTAWGSGVGGGPKPRLNIYYRGYT